MYMTLAGHKDIRILNLPTDKNLDSLPPSSFYDIHSLGQNDIKAPKNAFYFVSVFSEEEPDLNNELEVSVSFIHIYLNKKSN